MEFNAIRRRCAWHKTHLLLESSQVTQWRSEGRLLDWMPLYQTLVLSSGVWWSLWLEIRCWWRHNMTSYSSLQTNVLAKFVDTTCILFYTHSPYSLLYNVSLQWT